MRYRNRRPYKVTPDVLARMWTLRSLGKPYAVIGELCGVSRDCARKWLTGQTPKGAL